MTPEDHIRREEPPEPQDPLSAVLIRFGRAFGVAFLFVTAIAFSEVVLRYGFNAPTTWVHETTIFVTAMCFAFGGAYCLGADKHIRVVIIYDAVSPAIRRWMDVAISLVGLFACGLMAWAAWELSSKSLWTPQGEFRLETSGSAWNPPYPAIIKTFLFLILISMCVQFALQAWRHFRRDPHLDVHHGEPGKGIFDDA